MMPRSRPKNHEDVADKSENDKAKLGNTLEAHDKDEEPDNAPAPGDEDKNTEDEINRPGQYEYQN